MAELTRSRSFLGVAAREPTVHFALMTAALFALAAVVDSSNESVIEIDRAELEGRVSQMAADNGMPVNAEQRRQIEQWYVDEQVLVREALAIGLHDDRAIEAILVEKMLHVLSGEVIQPTDLEIRAYYEAHYASRPWVIMDVEEFMVLTTDPVPMELPAPIRNGVEPEELLEDGLPVGQLGDLSIGYRVLAAFTTRGLVRELGDAAAGIVIVAPPGEWVGPNVSVGRQSWFRVTSRIESQPPPLQTIQDEVRLDWIGEHEAARLAERVAELRGRYSVVFTGEEPSR